MLSPLSFLHKLWLKIKFGSRLKIASDVVIPLSTKFVIDRDSLIEISASVVIREFVELRATRASQLMLGQNVKLDRLVRIIATNNKVISIGSRCRIGLGSVLNGGGSIFVGEKTLISGYVYLQTSMHEHRKESDIIDSGYSYGDISIGDGAWLGAHTVIFPNVNLGDRVVVGSNAVVNQSFKAASLVGGIPAKELK